MRRKTKNKIKTSNIYTLLTLLTANFLVGSFYCGKVIADNSITEISQQDNGDDNQKKIEELQKRAEVYRQIIDIKKKQSDSLSNQLSITDSNLQQVQTEIDASNSKIEDYNSQIIRLTVQIKEKQSIIDAQRKMLADLLQSYYAVSQRNILTSYIADGDFSSFLVNRDNISQVSDKIQGLVNSITEMKSNLQQQSTELDKKKSEIVLTKQDLEEKNENLQNVKTQRSALLAQTKGEEVLYSKLLQRVEAEKQQLLNIDQFSESNISIGGLTVAEYIKEHQPSSVSNAPLSWYFSQKDSRWGSTTIGNSNSTMKQYGCAVTAVAMVFSSHGDNIDPGQLAKKPIFSWDLIAWPQSWPEAKLTMNNNGQSHGNINWTIIDTQLSKGDPVIVYIGKTDGSGGHYVVIHHKEGSTGKYVVHDPYFGPNLYLDTSRALVGSMGSQSATKVDQMIIYN